MPERALPTTKTGARLLFFSTRAAASNGEPRPGGVAYVTIIAMLVNQFD